MRARWCSIGVPADAADTACARATMSRTGCYWQRAPRGTGGCYVGAVWRCLAIALLGVVVCLVGGAAASASPPLHHNGRATEATLSHAAHRSLAGTVVLVAPTPAEGAAGSGVDAAGCGTGSNAPCATIQYAVDACPAGGTVQLLPGRHSASGNSSATCPAYTVANSAAFFPGVTTGGKAITIMSDPPQSATVDAQLCGRAFLFDAGETSATVVRDIRVRAPPRIAPCFHVCATWDAPPAHQSPRSRLADRQRLQRRRWMRAHQEL